MIIAIDGPAGAGKGTVAEKLAKKLNILKLDTGITYRALAYKCLKENITEEKDIIELSKNMEIKQDKNKNIFLDDENITKKIRTLEISNMASIVSVIIEVRRNMVELQRKMVKDLDAVVEGRDITTVVFPNAKYKFYLDASLEERAKRRYNETPSTSYEEIYNQIKERDYRDMHKEFGALKRTKDQIYIDSTNMSIDEVVDKMIEVIK